MSKLFLSLTLAGLLGGAALGCSKPAPSTTPAPAIAEPAPEPAPTVAEPAADGRPASITDADVGLADRLLDLMSKMSAGVVNAGSDCAQAAAEIRAVVPEFQTLAAEGKVMDERMKDDAVAKKWFDDTYGPKFTEIVGKMMSAPCMQDPAVQEAMGSLSF
ncbi:MAG: hypothetical protein R3B48_27935 [Kofleriaceae bacterium]